MYGNKLGHNKNTYFVISIEQNFILHLHYWYINLRTFIVICCIAVCLKEVLVSANWRWRDNGVEKSSSYTETCSSYV